MLPAPLPTTLPISDAIAALRARYKARADEFGILGARIDGSKLCALVVDDLDRLAAAAVAPADAAVEAVSTSEPSLTPPHGVGPSAQGDAAPASEPERRTGSNARRAAFRARMQQARPFSSTASVEPSLPPSLPIAGVSGRSYDPNADARAIAASLLAKGGRQ